MYIARANNAKVAGFRLTNPGVSGTSPGDAYGFVVRILDTGTVSSTAGTNAEGTWAYTAPRPLSDPDNRGRQTSTREDQLSRARNAGPVAVTGCGALPFSLELGTPP